MICEPKKHGILLGPAALVSCATHKGYNFWQLKAARQQVDITITPSGLLRISKPVKRTEYPKVDE